MHLGQKKLAENFELEDLQILDGPPMRGAKTVVRSACAVLNVTGAAFVVFDDLASQAVLRESAGHLTFYADYPLAGSLASDLRAALAPIKVNDLTERSATLPERIASGAAGFMAAPVLAPDGRAAGMLAALERSPRLWTSKELAQLEDLAHLISQEIILRASFATLGIMARERSRFQV